MFELKCDVKGCNEREPLFVDPTGGLSTLPPGWRLVVFEEQTFKARRDPAQGFIEAMTRQLPPEIAKEASAYFSAIAASSPVVASSPFQSRRQSKHMCSKHDMAFEDVHGADEDSQ